MVQVHHDEGVANRIDPESCADAREGIGEALTKPRLISRRHFGFPPRYRRVSLPSASVGSRRPCQQEPHRRARSHPPKSRAGCHFAAAIGLLAVCVPLLAASLNSSRRSGDFLLGPVGYPRLSRRSVPNGSRRCILAQSRRTRQKAHARAGIQGHSSMSHSRRAKGTG